MVPTDTPSNYSSDLFRISPNPTSGFVRIYYTGEREITSQLLVTDMTGKKLISESLLINNKVGKDINLGQFPSGIYMITLTDAKGKANVFKITKE